MVFRCAKLYPFWDRYKCSGRHTVRALHLFRAMVWLRTEWLSALRAWGMEKGKRQKAKVKRRKEKGDGTRGRGYSCSGQSIIIIYQLSIIILQLSIIVFIRGVFADFIGLKNRSFGYPVEGIHFIFVGVGGFIGLVISEILGSMHRD